MRRCRRYCVELLHDSPQMTNRAIFTCYLKLSLYTKTVYKLLFENVASFIPIKFIYFVLYPFTAPFTYHLQKTIKQLMMCLTVEDYKIIVAICLQCKMCVFSELCTFEGHQIRK